MGLGYWTRWGRGSCEGYGMELGKHIRFSIVAEGHAQPRPRTWAVSLNAVQICVADTFEEAVAHAEAVARNDMALANEHLQRLNDGPPARRRVGRIRK